MILVIGGKASGKRAYARSLGFPDDECAFDVHELATTKEEAPGLARELGSRSVVTCSEVGSGVVPLSAEDRAWRDAVGALARVLAQQAQAVVRMVCGVPLVLKDDTGMGERLMRPSCVELVVIRHGQTPGNGMRRYVGARDEPLSDEGREQARNATHYPQVARVYVSKLRRTHETAAILFPHAEQIVVDGVQEMNFGVFAGRSADDMEDDADYRAWVDGYCEGRCPGGESRDEFTDRVCTALEDMVRQAAERGERCIYLVAHGGTMMASLSRFATSDRSYYDWHVGNCKGYRIRVDLTGDQLAFTEVAELD